MSELLKKYDYLLKDGGPAAIVLKHWLKPVGDAIIFPPTYANPSQRKGDPAVYNIDRFGETSTLGKKFERFEKSHTFMEAERIEYGREHSVCVIDSIPSQANRIEPAFSRMTDRQGKPVRLVPKAVVEATVNGQTIEVDLLEAGHRAADAVVRMSAKGADLAKATESRQSGDSMLLAKLAPTSLVFGMWDSRDTGVKVPRLINSIIRAHDVVEYRRSSQFNPAMDFEAAGVVREAKDKKLSEVGMDGAPATFQLGGVEARGGICRDAAINLCTLRDIVAKSCLKKEAKSDALEFEKLTALPDIKGETERLQRYILGLALVAVTYFDGKTLNLRQGCQLVGVPEKPMTRALVMADGTEGPFDVDLDGAIAYAAEAAGEFGVGPDWAQVKFDVKAAKASLKKTKKEVEQEKS
jgi:CRISPR-associated protein Csb1